ncbi:MAG: hypothetical protein R3F61_21455 [Myxococcota bacterium]
MRHTPKLAAVAIAILASVACKSVVTGNEGNFRFSYLADEAFLDFNKAIAVGAKLDVNVTQVGDDQPVGLTDAAAEDPAVFGTEITGANIVTITGLAEGNTELQVKGTNTSGEEQTDSVNLRVLVPDIHRMRHSCQNFNGVEATDYAYLTGQSVYVPFDFEANANSGTEPVIGYGYYPIQIDGPATLDASFQGSQYMRIDMGAPGSVTFTSDIDASTLDLTIVDEADIDGVLQPIAFVLEDIDVGDVNPFYVLPSAAGMPICQADVTLAVASTTPDICDVRLANSLAGNGSDQGKEFGWFEIEGVAAGMCEYTVTYPTGADGAGATQAFTYEIQP